MAADQRGPSLASDRRAYVPFAVIGVFLLLTSVTVIAVLETREDPEIDTGSAQAYDRTTSAVHSGLQSATSDALHGAAAHPVTAPDASNPVGQAIDGSDVEETFTNYVKLRVYLEAREQLPHAGQRVGGDTVTTVEVPEYSDPADAVANVTLEVGGDALDDYGDPGGADLPDGAVRATIPDVQITVREDNATVAQRTEDYTVTVGSSAFELHNRTELYDRQLDGDFGDAPSFARGLSARLYRFAWYRGHEQRDGAPVADVLGERHVETLANDALLGTQRRVFGNVDPYGNRTLVRSYACTIGRDAPGLYNDTEVRQSDVTLVADHANESGFCGEPEAIYGGLPADLSRADPPDWLQLVPDRGYATEDVEIDLAQAATASMGETGTEGAIDTAIDRVYEVDVSVESDVETTVDAGSPDGSEGWSVESFAVDSQSGKSVWVEDSRRVVSEGAPGPETSFYEFDVVYVGEYTGDVTWSDGSSTQTRTDVTYSVTYDATFTVTGEHSPRAHSEARGIVNAYTTSGLRNGSILATNFEGVPGDALVQAVAAVGAEGVYQPNTREQQLETYLQATADGVHDADDLEDAVVAREPRLDVEPHADGERIRGWVVEDLEELRQNLSVVNTTVNRTDLLNGTSPVAPLRDRVTNDSWIYGSLDDSYYANAPDKVRVETRLEYLDWLGDEVDATLDAHRATMTELDDAITDHTAGNLSRAAAFAPEWTGPGASRPSAHSSSQQLLDDVELVPDGEPTYLTFDRVNVTHVPATGTPPHDFAPAAGRSGEQYARPHQNGVGPGRVRLQTAGAVLEAGKAADNVTAADWTKVDDLEASLSDQIDAIAADAAAQAHQPFRGSSEVTQSELEAAIHDELSRIGPVERQAIYLGSGRPVIDRVARNVSTEFATSRGHDYEYTQYRDQIDHLETAVRHGLEHSIRDGRVGGYGVPGDTRALDGELRRALDTELRDAMRERLDQTASQQFGPGTATTTTGQTWLESAPGAGDYAPNRVPAGHPVIDRPKHHDVTANLWQVTLEGEYARFTARASEASALSGASTELVREDETVTLEYDGTEYDAGDVEPVGFRTNVSVLVAVPAEGLGVGDRTDESDWCSETYDQTGPIHTESFHACAGP